MEALQIGDIPNQLAQVQGGIDLVRQQDGLLFIHIRLAGSRGEEEVIGRNLRPRRTGWGNTARGRPTGSTGLVGRKHLDCQRVGEHFLTIYLYAGSRYGIRTCFARHQDIGERDGTR